MPWWKGSSKKEKDDQQKPTTSNDKEGDDGGNDNGKDNDSDKAKDSGSQKKAEGAKEDDGESDKIANVSDKGKDSDSQNKKTAPKKTVSEKKDGGLSDTGKDSTNDSDKGKDSDSQNKKTAPKKAEGESRQREQEKEKSNGQGLQQEVRNKKTAPKYYNSEQQQKDSEKEQSRREQAKNKGKQNKTVVGRTNPEFRKDKRKDAEKKVDKKKKDTEKAKSSDQENGDAGAELLTKRKSLDEKELYPENMLKHAEGGFNDFLPPWAFPRVQIKASVTGRDASKELERNPDLSSQVVLEERVDIKYTIDAISKKMVKAVLSQFKRLTISKIHHLARLGEFATVLFQEKKLVDVLVHVWGKTFYAHKIVLCCHSEFFATLLMPFYNPPDVITDVTLNNIHPNYFQDFLHFCYYGEVQLNEQNIPALLNMCNKLNAPILRARIHMFIATHGELHPDLIKKILTTQIKADRALAILEAIEKFDELRDDVQFVGRLSLEDIMEILSNDDLNIKSELDVFWTALIWVADDVRGRFDKLDMLLQTVRVTCMTTLEIMDICRASKLIRLSQHCQQLMMNATWVCHAREIGLNDPLSLPIQAPRRRLIGAPPYQPTSEEFDKRYHQYKSVIGENDSEEFLMTLESTGKSRGRVIFADEKGGNLEHVQMADPRNWAGLAGSDYSSTDDEENDEIEIEKKKEKKGKRKSSDRKESSSETKVASDSETKVSSDSETKASSDSETKDTPMSAEDALKLWEGGVFRRRVLGPTISPMVNENRIGMKTDDNIAFFILILTIPA